MFINYPRGLGRRFVYKQIAKYNLYLKLAEDIKNNRFYFRGIEWMVQR